MLDNHLMATVNNRIEAVQGAPFKLVDRQGKEKDEMTDLFKKRWFIDFIELALMSKYTGTQVIEIYKTRDTGELDRVDAIDPAHVIPQKGLVVKEPGDTTGHIEERTTTITKAKTHKESTRQATTDLKQQARQSDSTTQKIAQTQEKQVKSEVVAKDIKCSGLPIWLWSALAASLALVIWKKSLLKRLLNGVYALFKP